MNKSKMVSVRFTEAEKVALEQQAEAECMPLAFYLRRLIVAAAKLRETKEGK